MAVLYRKYRPQRFSEVVGQKIILQTLQNQVSSGLVAHAYLFTGSRGVGKTSVARILAKAVNCVNSQPSLSALSAGHLPPKGEKNNVQASPGALGDACGECSVCKAIENNNFIDLIEIDAASNTGVDNVRDIIEHVKFAPSTGKYKVFIIDEVHMLSKGAFNALLKTLEEPPKHSIFILATTEIQKVPATIISRTQRFDFKASSISDIQEHLGKIANKEGHNYGTEILNLVALNAQGSLRDALSILDKIATLGESATLDDVSAVLGVTDFAYLHELGSLIISGQANLLPDFYDRLLEKGTDFSVFNKDFLEFLRKLLISKITEQKNLFSGSEHDKKIKDSAEKISLANLIFVIRLFLKSFKDLQGASSGEIPLLLASVEGALKNQTAGNVKTAKVVLESLEAMPQISNIPPAKPETVAENQKPLVYENVTIEEVMEFWPQVIAVIKEQNGPLGSLLKACQVSAIESGRLVLHVKYEFDRKTLEKNAGLISESIKTISGKNLGINGKVSQLADIQPSPVAALNDALKIFGGELVE